jgi:hypothetical protein
MPVCNGNTAVKCGIHSAAHFKCMMQKIFRSSEDNFPALYHSLDQYTISGSKIFV